MHKLEDATAGERLRAGARLAHPPQSDSVPGQFGSGGRPAPL